MKKKVVDFLDALKLKILQLPEINVKVPSRPLSGHSYLPYELPLLVHLQEAGRKCISQTSSHCNRDKLALASITPLYKESDFQKVFLLVESSLY